MLFRIASNLFLMTSVSGAATGWLPSKLDLGWIETRSLPLPVLTSYIPRSIAQFVFKNEASDLNRAPAIDRRTDQQRVNHTALAIDARIDLAHRFTARGAVETYANDVVVYSLITKNVLTRLQQHAA